MADDLTITLRCLDPQLLEATIQTYADAVLSNRMTTAEAEDNLDALVEVMFVPV